MELLRRFDADTLAREWPDLHALQALLNTPEGQDQFLQGSIAIAAQERGLAGPAEIFSFTVHPAPGGPISAENAMNHVVASSICGQLCQQLTHLRPGTPIMGFELDE